MQRTTTTTARPGAAARRRLPTRAPVTVLTVAVLVAGAAGLASAAVPHSATSKVSACVRADGSLRVIDRQQRQVCDDGESLLEWQSRGMRYRGAWAPRVQYYRDDVVGAAGGTYVALGNNRDTDVKDPAAWAAVAATGPQGPAGPVGPAGPTGPRGPAGPARVVTASPDLDSLTVFAHWTSVFTLTPGAGTWMVDGKVLVSNWEAQPGGASPARTACALSRNNSRSVFLDTTELRLATVPGANASQILLSAPVTLAASDTISLLCHAELDEGNGSEVRASSVRLTATQASLVAPSSAS